MKSLYLFFRVQVFDLRVSLGDDNVASDFYNSKHQSHYSRIKVSFEFERTYGELVAGYFDDFYDIGNF